MQDSLHAGHEVSPFRPRPLGLHDFTLIELLCRHRHYRDPRHDAVARFVEREGEGQTRRLQEQHAPVSDRDSNVRT